ncbi:protein SPT2 homolog [Cydia fagiglandana]|uniref:protein SPT2 homolog n=1 Tax=Cydia fagiglandana TaxID=1458189 RepID=UPI002FEDE689
MEFRETLLAAQRNQQQKSSRNTYYRAGFDPPKKEQRQKDKLSENILKFLAKKDEEEKQKQLEAQKKKEELLAMRDPKALRKIQKTLKTIKSANKSVIEDAVDHDNTAVTRAGPDQPDQDDYGYESQEAAAFYGKLMQKYSKIPDEPKFPMGKKSVKTDLKGTMERVKNALAHEDDPVPHKRRRRTENGERESSPPQKYEPEKRKEEKPEKPKFRKPAPPPMDFNQLLKLAEEKKSAPIEVPRPVSAKPESEPERLMTKKQRREYEEELARRQRRQERIDAEKNGRRPQKEERDRPADKEKKPEPSGFGRIPKIGEKTSSSQPSNSGSTSHKHDSTKTYERSKDKPSSDRDRADKLQREKERARQDRDKADREKERLDRERLDKLKAERERIDREMERLNRDRDRLEKTKMKLESSKSYDKPSKDVDRSKLSSKDQFSRQEVKKNIDLKSQNTYRIDKNSNDKKFTIPSKNGESKYTNGHSSQSKLPQRSKEDARMSDRDRAIAKQRASQENGKRPPESKPRRPEERGKAPAAPGKPAISNSFDFDKHVSSLAKDKLAKRPDARRKMDDPRKKQKRRAIDSESEYDSEMDDFIDDGDENMDYSTHIKEIFGYDKSKYRDMDDDDDPTMESSFARQQREEYISKKIGIMEDLEDMRMEAMEKKKVSKKKRRISDD